MYISWLPLLLYGSLTAGSAHLEVYKGVETTLLYVWGLDTRE